MVSWRSGERTGMGDLFPPFFPPTRPPALFPQPHPPSFPTHPPALFSDLHLEAQLDDLGRVRCSADRLGLAVRQVRALG